MAQKKILIVDDEEEILDILEKKFKQNNYDVLTLYRGNEVIKKCLAFKPDLLVLDIVMPEIDGFSIAVNLRQDKSLKNTPIIFMTAKELEYSGIEKRLADLDYCSFIRKPYNFQELFEKVKTIIG